jgi:hypothetical protein
VLWIHVLAVLMLVQRRWEMLFLTAFIVVLLHNSDMNILTACSVFRTGKRGNGGSDFSYCSTVKSECYANM